MARPRKYGVAMVVSGPSGTGKTTLCQSLSQRHPELCFSVSCTTRPPRRGEVDGRDYRFISEPEFRTKIEAGEFLEFAEVHGFLYGTLCSDLERWLLEGRDVWLDIDLEGKRQIARRMAGTELGKCIVYVFIGSPSMQVIERRLRNRGTENEELLARRLSCAARELAAWSEYDYLIVNDQLKLAVRSLESVLLAARAMTACYSVPPWSE